MKIHRRSALIGIVGLYAAPSTFAQGYPKEPLKWIIPYTAGGGSDRLARAISAEMQASFREPIVVDYKPGAGTIIGAQFVANSKPDGYTVMSVDNSTLVYNPFLHKKLGYDPEKSFTPIGAIGRFPMALVAHPSMPVKNLSEFIAHAKSSNRPIPYSSPGVGSPHHINMEMLADRAKIAVQHVAYRGGAPAIQAVLANETPVMMLDILTGIELMRSGKLRTIAIASTKRAQSLPDVETMAEAGLADIELYAWQGMVAPAGLQPETQMRLNQELNKALLSPSVQQQFRDAALQVMPGTPQQFLEFTKAERAIWGKLIEAKKISAE